MRKRIDAGRQLAHWADTVMGQPFVWGVSDCFTIVRSALEVMTGSEFPSPGEYSDLPSALRVFVGAKGFTDDFIWFCDHGMARVGALLWAQPNDVLAWNGPDGEPRFGVVVGRDVLLAEPDKGVYTLPLRRLIGEPSAVQTATVYRVP